MDEVAKLLGLGAPVAAAGAIYWLFSFLDKKASDEANNVLSSWMRGESYKKIDLGNAVLSAFDHLYSAPLFRWKAFRRSAMLSLCAGLIYFGFWLYEIMNAPISKPEFAVGFASGLALVVPILIIADYFSLYVIRACLNVARKSALLSILISLIFGLFAIFVVIVIAGLGIEETAPLMGVEMSVRDERSLGAGLSANMVVFPALLVHLWLPLFLIGALLNRGVSAFFRTAGFAQRFMKHGDEHPFDAIGIVAATVVFVGTTLWQIGSHVI
jgi:hypothetical protein